MKLFDNIHIKNFRGIREADVSSLGSINVFLGKNNCGKSSLLESVFLLTGPNNPMLPIRLNSFRSYGLFREYDMLLDFYNLDPQNIIELSATGSVRRKLSISTFFDEVGEVRLDSMANGGSNSQAKFYGLNHTFWIGENKTEYRSKLSIQQGDLSKGQMGVDIRYDEPIKSLYIPSAYMQSPVNEVYGRLTESKQDGPIVDILRTIEPKILDMKLIGKELMVDIGIKQLLPLNMMGDGLRKLVSIVLAVYECRDGIIAIDEIDNGFHYSTMLSLWKALALASKESGAQVFLTTHNIDFLKGLTVLLHDENYHWLEQEISAYKLVKNDADVLSALRYDSGTIGYSIEQEIEIR